MVEPKQRQHRCAIRRLRHGGHAFAGKNDPIRIGIIADQLPYQHRCERDHCFAAIERTKPRSYELLLPVTIGFAESRTGLRQDDSSGDGRAFRQQLLNDHSADRVPDQYGLGGTDLLQEIVKSIGKRGNADSLQRLGGAVPWHVPGDGTIAASEKIELTAPGSGRAADAMEEYDGRRRTIAGGFIAKSAVRCFTGLKCSHAESLINRTCRC